MDHWKKRGAMALLLLLVLSGLAGCAPGSMTAPGWGGLGLGGDTLYVATSRGKVYALDSGTGVQRWVYPHSEKEAGGPFYSNVIATEDLVLTSSFGGVLYALDAATSMERWTFEREKAFVGAPAVAGGEVYVGNADGKVYALDAASGLVKWELETGNWVWSSPIVDGDRLYVASMDHKMYCLDRLSGRKLW